jgi:glycosyltransferase involved in cell wall biosynthesis
MAARNAAPYITASVRSVLRQTLRDLELLVLDDASTDTTGTILDGLARRDGRVRLFRNARQLGVARSLNFLAGQARSPLCARMDADDLAHPDRLRRQW